MQNSKVMKTHKEKLLEKEALKLRKKIKEIDFLLDARPLSEIINLRIEGQKLLDANKGLEDRLNPAFAQKISEMAKKEKYWFGIADKQKNTLKLIDQKVEYVSALDDISSDLYWFEEKRRRIDEQNATAKD